jgi:hypothetical protein
LIDSLSNGQSANHLNQLTNYPTNKLTNHYETTHYLF